MSARMHPSLLLLPLSGLLPLAACISSDRRAGGQQSCINFEGETEEQIDWPALYQIKYNLFDAKG